MKNIAIFGGTFNPIHNGHINLCNQITSYYNFDEIIIIPSNIPPHKQVEFLASNDDRINMCKLATQHNPIFSVSDIEIKLKGVSYTINTIEKLKEENPNANFYMIIGSDMLYMFNKWKRYEDILNNVTVICGARYSEEYDKMIQSKNSLGSIGDKIEIVRIDVMTLSSTFIREQLIKGHSWKEYLDEKVYNYIKDKNIYL